ncbi:hypothetical protein BV22DRAFT_1135744 [Leucogyrophana mollusca]|uniref:Uncharacterized protein n=1 Tax=Leucogyrophana mollusca TaxID=85980 RepID=A0ACB8AUG3_9AGAM|nr:hypothetical protein BV22DRAFT_1135744 [Leucogyrophana mollusca]
MAWGGRSGVRTRRLRKRSWMLGLGSMCTNPKPQPARYPSWAVPAIVNGPLTSVRRYEIIAGPLPPLEAADAPVHTRETVYNIANKHGLRATLAPYTRVADGIWSGGMYVAWGVTAAESPWGCATPLLRPHVTSK